MAVLGDLIYRGVAAWKWLLGNATTTRKFLSQTGDGVNSAVPDWVQPASTDISDFTEAAQDAAGAMATEGIQYVDATPALKADINGLTADATPDSAADYVMTYDASAAVHKKVLLANMPSGGGAPTNATYLTATAESGLSAEVNLGALASGILKQTVSAGVSTPAIAAAGTDYVAPNAGITGATKTKITYDAKGLVTAGADATTADIADSADKRYVTDAELVVIGNTSGTNTGNVTLAGTPDYITIVGQVITRALINLASHVTGRLPFANLVAATAAAVLVGRRSGSTGDFEQLTTSTDLAVVSTVLGLVNTAVTPATYGDSTHVGQFTADAKGRITSATSVAITPSGIGAADPIFATACSLGF